MRLKDRSETSRHAPKMHVTCTYKKFIREMSHQELEISNHVDDHVRAKYEILDQRGQYVYGSRSACDIFVGALTGSYGKRHRG
jgi:hypothetical protein